MSFQWDFQNDGTIDSTAENPTFTYSMAGTYAVKLVATNAHGADEEVKTGYITVDAPSGTTTSTFFADADARVQEATPSTNYGGSYLRADGGSDPDVESYLRFSVTGAATVESAKLRVYATSGTLNGPAIYSALDTSWSETGITWASRPLRSALGVDDKAAIGAHTWAEYDVSSLVSGDGVYTFALATSSTDGLNLSSREATNVSLRPQLVVTSSEASAGPPTADFTAAPTDGIEPLTVSFTDRSQARTAGVRRDPRDHRQRHVQLRRQGHELGHRLLQQPGGRLQAGAGREPVSRAPIRPPLRAVAEPLTRREAARRIVAVAALNGMAAAHLLDLPHKLAEAPYLAALFCGLIVASLALAAGLVYGGSAAGRICWPLAGALAATAMAGYGLSRSIGLPGIESHVGAWGDPVGVASLALEATLLCAFAAGHRPHARRAALLGAVIVAIAALAAPAPSLAHHATEAPRTPDAAQAALATEQRAVDPAWASSRWTVILVGWTAFMLSWIGGEALWRRTTPASC